MNKKGALFHWIIFGVIIGFAIFAFGIIDPEIDTKLKGDWQVYFLETLYYPAQKVELQYSAQQADAVRLFKEGIDSKGGFKETSPCGENYWNTFSEWCAPQIKDYFSEQFKEGKWNENKFTISLAEPIKNKNKEDWYEYNQIYTTDLSAYFNQYASLFSQSQQLVQQCNNHLKLKECLDEKGWEYTLTERKAQFSVQGIKFGLDFTTQEPYLVEDLSLQKVETGYEIVFSAINNADSYNLYHTSYSDLDSGHPIEIFSGVSPYPTKIPIAVPITDCLIEKVPGVSCAENDLIIYYLSTEEDLNNDYFAVTALEDETEGQIFVFVPLE